MNSNIFVISYKKTTMKKLNRTKTSLKLFGLAIITIAPFYKSYAQNKKPNVIIILADDFGYGSLNSYGADKKLVRTPHIDGLAETGMRFTHAHTPASVSSPTRYSLITGSYPWRSSLKNGVVSSDEPLLPDPEKQTIADLLKEQSYNTAAIGKWHLGYGDKEPCDFTGKLTPGPLDLGFDYHFGIPNNNDDSWGVYVENDEIYGLKSKQIHPFSRTTYGPQYRGFDAPQRENKNVMGEITTRAEDWLKRQSPEKPFFLYFAPVAVHEPIIPSDYMRGVSNCGPYGDFIQDLDLSVGRIIDILKYLNLYDNTIIIFSSDNGGVAGFKKDSEQNQAIKYGLKINGDLKGGKHSIFEGGTNVPFIVSWPRNIEPGAVSDDLVNMADIFATVAEITGKGLSDNKTIAPDSYSFLPSLLKKENRNPRATMVTADSKGMHAIRKGDWKLIDNTPPFQFSEKIMSEYKKEKPLLYNLKDDPSEHKNLFDNQPEIVKELMDELNKIRNTSSSR